jgi:hypothetical protein
LPKERFSLLTEWDGCNNLKNIVYSQTYGAREEVMISATIRGVPPAAKLVFASLALVFLSLACSDKPPPVPSRGKSAINVLKEPLQEPCDPTPTYQKRITGGAVTITPVAIYRIAGEVMSKRKYTHGWGSEIMPFDLALVWGMLTYPHVQKQLSIKHDSTRMAWFRMKGDDPPVDLEYAMSHGSNNHIIPANDNIREIVENQIRIHDRVVLEGYLVNVEGRNKEQRISLKSSLSRTDADRGACEIIYVTSVQVERKR